MAFIGNNLGSITTEARTVDTMVGDGTTATLTLSKTPGSVNNVEVFFDGIFKTPGEDFTLAGSTLTFTTPPPNAVNVVALSGNDSQVVFPEANSITTKKILDNTITSDKFVDVAVEKLSGTLPALDGSAVTGLILPDVVDVTTAASDPTRTTNKPVGSLAVNSTSGEMFMCTDAETDNNTWMNIGVGTGSVIYTPPPPFGGIGGGTISGYNTGGHIISAIEKYSLVSNGSSSVVGNLTSGRNNSSASSSTTHGYTCGGWDVTVAGGYAYAIDKFSFSTHGNASAVGDLSTGNSASRGNTSSTHGYVTGGDAGGGLTSTIQKYSFSVDGNTVLYSGVLTVGRSFAGSGSSGTHGYTSTGHTSSLTFTAHIDKFSFSSEGNATDHGDMGLIRYGGAGHSTLDHGYVSGGRTNGNDYLNIIAKYSFDNGNGSIDHGDLVIPRYYPTSTSSVTDGYSTAGFKSGGYACNDIDKFSFASASGANSIGSLTAGKYLCMGHQV